MGDISSSIFAYDYKLERWETWTETHTETETKIENGQEVEYTYDVDEEVSDWKLREQDKKWARINLADIKIDTGACEIQLDWQQTFTD